MFRCESASRSFFLSRFGTGLAKHSVESGFVRLVLAARVCSAPSTRGPAQVWPWC